MRLQLGLRRSLICFAPLAFVPQRQEKNSNMPSPLVFLLISTHFTAPPQVPVASFSLYPLRLLLFPEVRPRSLKQDCKRRLRDTLRPMNPDNAWDLRITATAGT